METPSSHTTGENLFPEWPKDDVRSAETGRTYFDPDAIPEALRTASVVERNDRTKSHCSVELLATLRRCGLGVYAEIVLVDWWDGYRQDGNVFYRVNLSTPHGYDRRQVGTISLNDEGIDDIQSTLDLLADAKKFIRWHKRQEQQRLEALIESAEMKS